MFNSVVQQLAHHAEHQDGSCQNRPLQRLRAQPHSTWRWYKLYVYCGQWWCKKIIISDKRHLVQCLKSMVFRRHGQTQEQFNEQRRRAHEKVPVLQQGYPNNTQNLVHQARDYWWSRSYIALQYHQEQFENAVQEPSTGSFWSSRNCAALATDRTAAQLTSRFRHSENHVEGTFSHQQRGLLSEVTSESAQALEAHRHSRVQEATTEMMRRDAHSADVLSQVRNELQFSSSRWRSIRWIPTVSSGTQTTFGTINYRRRTDEESLWWDQDCGCQFCIRSCSSTCSRISTIHQSLDYAKSSDGVTRVVAKSPPWEYSDQWSQESIHITNSSINTRHQELTQIADAKPRKQSFADWSFWLAKFSGAESMYRTSRRRESSTFEGGTNFLGSSKYSPFGRDWTINLELIRSVKGDGAHSISARWRAKYYEQLELHCRRNVPNWCRIWRHFSGYRTHRWRDTSVYSTRCLRCECSVFHSIRFFSSDSGRKTQCKKKTKHNLEEQGNRRRLQQPWEPCAMQSTAQRCPSKEADRIEFKKLPNSTTFVIWKMKFKEWSLLQLKFFRTDALVWHN